ncbi:MAG: class I SAM-dependent methyltransferase [Brevundimonas sp.]
MTGSNSRAEALPLEADPVASGAPAGTTGWAVSQLLRRVIVRGDLKVHGLSGSEAPEAFGDGRGPSATIRLTAEAARRIAADPELGVGECYMDGSLIVEDGCVRDLLEIIFLNPESQTYVQERIGALGLGVIRKLHRKNSRKAARTNVAHHYDLSRELYELFLDPDLQYSCAYYARPGMSLEAAQRAKKTHIIAKLLLEPGQTVLDIGCGWGGMARQIAETEPVQVTGVTLSPEQLAVARERALPGTHFALQDYRDVKAQFDRVVSVGMFEHVGLTSYDEYFATIARVLRDDGVALIHSIGRKDGPSVNNPWIEKYIFPGGYIPSLSEVLPAIEKAGLWVTDIEILRLHYAETLKDWNDRFQSRRDAAAALYDERFCRMWEFYLAASEMSFRHHGHMVFQIQLAKRVDTVPLTRDYITETERARSGLRSLAA